MEESTGPLRFNIGEYGAARSMVCASPQVHSLPWRGLSLLPGVLKQQRHTMRMTMGAWSGTMWAGVTPTGGRWRCWLRASTIPSAEEFGRVVNLSMEKGAEGAGSSESWDAGRLKVAHLISVEQTRAG